MTTTSDLQTHLDGIGHVLSDNYLAVPIFQRSYSWEEEHISEFFQDIARALKDEADSYFLGAIVVVGSGDEQLEVVDGQQRLATTMILLAAIRDHIYAAGDKEWALDIERKYLIDKDISTREERVKLHLNETDHDFFAKRVLSRPGSPERDTRPSHPSHKRIEKASQLAAKRVGLIYSSTNQVQNLIDWVAFIQSKAQVIWFRVPDYSHAFTIFETLNDRGLDLAISDLLKNYLISVAANRRAEVHARWTSMIAVLESADSEAKPATYIRHYWSSKYGFVREKDLYGDIKVKVATKQGAVDFAEELSSGSKYYAAIINPGHELWDHYRASARRDMYTLNLLKAMQIRPLILSILGKLSQSELPKAMRLLVSWTVRFLVTSGGGTGTQEQQYSLKAADIWNGNIKTAKELLGAMKTIVPPDSRFEDAFAIAQISDARLARYYLAALDAIASPEADSVYLLTEDPEAVNLEHVLPQSPSATWGSIDVETTRAYYKRLGNLALMKTKINSTVGNKGFLEKRPFYASSPFELTQALAKYPSWGPDQITERQVELARLAVKAWPNRV